MEKERKAVPFDLCERTLQYSVHLVKYCQCLERSGSVARTLANQLLRSGTSIGANIEEAQAGQSRADFIAKYSIARKEARETRYWLRVIRASGIRITDETELMLREAEELILILATIIKKTRLSAKRP